MDLYSLSLFRTSITCYSIKSYIMIMVHTLPTASCPVLLQIYHAPHVTQVTENDGQLQHVFYISCFNRSIHKPYHQPPQTSDNFERKCQNIKSMFIWKRVILWCIYHHLASSPTEMIKCQILGNCDKSWGTVNTWQMQQYYWFLTKEKK